MSPAVWLIAIASLGIDVGWQPVDEGGYELFLQIEPEQLELLRAGEPLTSDLPSFAERVVRVHWMIGTDQLPQTTRPSAAANDSAATETTAHRPVEGAVAGDLALTDGRTAKPADVPPVATSSTSDSWRTETAAGAREPAVTSEAEPAPGGSVDASLANVGPVDPSETDVDLSDGIEVASTPTGAPHDGSAAATTQTDAAAAIKPALDKETIATASTTTPAVEQHRARPESPPAAAPPGTTESTAKDTVATDAPDVASPGMLNWLGTMAALGASLAANVFFLWGFVDARRRYRLALHEHGLRNSALQAT